MLLAAFLTGAFCVAATGAWYLLRREFTAEGQIMLRMGLYLAAVLVPVQIFFGHLTGDYVHDYQPAKFAAIEGRWHDEQPASEVLIAIPDAHAETNRYAISVPVLGSLIGSMSFNSKEVGLTDFPREDRPPVTIPFFSFRIMVGCGIAMLLLAWAGTYLSIRGRLERNRPLLWLIFLSFPLPFIAILTGWFTAEVGRQPWTVYGVLRTADAMTPFLTARAATISLVMFCALYALIFVFGVLYIHRLLRAGPVGHLALPPAAAVPNRPMSVVDQPRRRPRYSLAAGRVAMVLFWVFVLALSVLLYVLLDGFDLGVGILFGLTNGEARRSAHAERRRADLGRQRNLAGRRRRGALGRLSPHLRDFALCLLSSAFRHARRPDPARSSLRVSLQDRADALDLGCRLRRRLARRDVHAGHDGRRAGRGASDRRMADMPAANSAGSARSR